MKNLIIGILLGFIGGMALIEAAYEIDPKDTTFILEATTNMFKS